MTETTIQVFFSYSHRDEPLRDELAKSLKLLERQGIIQAWHDRRISAGTEWANQIDDNLNAADIILLLVSNDFLASDYCYDLEMTRAMERHQAGEARVIPIILRPCDWHSAPFGKLQALPKNGEPVVSKKWDHIDSAFLDISQAIRRVAQELKEAGNCPPSPPILGGTNLKSPPNLVGGTNLKSPPNLVGGTNLKSPPNLGDLGGIRDSGGIIENLPNGITLDMVAIPGGIFYMGSPDGEDGHQDRESPQHLVTVPPFFMGKYPVTQAQWFVVANLPKVERDLNPNPAYFKGLNRPVECVSWYDAVEFCRRLSQVTGKDYRLPSEAEWEYACRAGTMTPFYFGEQLNKSLANYGGGKTTPVGNYPPNGFGLYDMHGNVREWCYDTWHENYQGAPIDGSAWLEDRDDSCSPLRGGSFDNYPNVCRSASRSYDRRDDNLQPVGFRVVCVSGRTLL